MRDKGFVGINTEGEIRTHLPPANGSYATLCGLDGDDFDTKAVYQASVKPGKRVTCAACWAIYQVCMQYRTSDFAAVPIGT